MINKKIHKQISRYFYVEKKTGKTKKLKYCTLCMKGPFVIEDEGREIFELLPDIRYCCTCMRLHNYKVPEVTTGEEWIVYKVECKDGTIYCGTTQNLDQAIKYLNAGSGSKHLRLKSKRPVTLVESVKVDSKSEAIKLKKEIQ